MDPEGGKQGTVAGAEVASAIVQAEPIARARAAIGLGAFFTVWGGQLVSITGTTLTGFGLQMWVFLETGSVTQLALVGVALALPATVLSPVAGALVDRWDRRVVMLGADLLAGASTGGIALLHFSGSLEVWHLYLLIGVGAVGNAFQAPAWMAAIPLLVPKRHLGRANGLVQANDAVALVVAPALAGALLATTGLGAILVVDLATFMVAVATLVVVRFPRPPASVDAATGRVIQDVLAGWHYLRDRPGLLWLLWTYAGVNFVLSFTNMLLIPLIISFASESAAGAVLSAAGIGMLVGSLAVGAWGGPKKRIRGVMAGIAFAGLLVAVEGLRPSLPLIAAATVLTLLTLPVVNATSQVLWQIKVPPAMQGRVFALRRMLAQFTMPLAMILSGPLADKVFEPLLAEGGGLADSVGSIIGTGPGRGIGFMFILAGIATVGVAALGWLHPRVRNLEAEVPDQIPDLPAPPPTG